MKIYNYTTDPCEQLPEHRELNEGEVHTWFFPLRAEQSVLQSQRGLLTEDECRQMDRFKLPELTRRFTIARAMQRVVLGAYYHADPKNVHFEYTAHGKPFLPGSSLQFNASHSGDYGIIAVAQQRQVGIDIECIRQISVLSIAKRFFLPEEYEYLASLSEAEQQKTFFRIWTRKEAFIKARGLSLSSYLSDVHVAIPLDDNPSRVWLGKEECKVNKWTVSELNLVEEVCSSLVVEESENAN